MPKYLFNMWAIIEAKDLDEAEDTIYKLINADLPSEVSEKLIHFEWEDVTEIEDEN